MNIRKATLEDDLSIQGLLNPSHTDATLKDNVQILIESNIAGLYVYDLGGTIVGLMSVVFIPGLGLRSFLKINEFTVHFNYYGLGIGKELLLFAESLAREKNCAHIEWNCNHAPGAVHRFILQHGFQKSSECFIKSLAPSLIPSAFII